MNDKHLKALRDSRKIYVKNKRVVYSDNFVEFYKNEKSRKILPDNDEILKMINDIKILNENEVFLQLLQTGKYQNYDFESLPKELKRYMRQIDNYYFEVEYQQYLRQKNGVNIEEYEKKEEQFYKVYGALEGVEGAIERSGLYEKHVILGHNISTLGKKAKDSARRAYKTVIGLYRANAHKFKYFVTLTFAPEKEKDKHLRKNEERLEGEKEVIFEYIDGLDFERAKEAYVAFMKVFRKELKRKGIELEYLTVWELQKNGAYHFHLLCSDIPERYMYKTPEWLDYDYKKKRFNNGFSLNYWKYGKSDIQEIRDNNKMTTYISKYILKSFLEVDEDSYEKYMNQKKYFPSRNLIKPTESYVTDKEIDLEIERLKEKEKSCYTRTYNNSYSKTVIHNTVFSLK